MCVDERKMALLLTVAIPYVATATTAVDMQIIQVLEAKNRTPLPSKFAAYNRSFLFDFVVYDLHDRFGFSSFPR